MEGPLGASRIADRSIFDSLMAEARKVAEQPAKLTARDVFDPYREAIQECLNARMSVGKIFELLKAQGLGTEFKVNGFAKYVRANGYIIHYGKYAGLPRDEVKRLKKLEATPRLAAVPVVKGSRGRGSVRDALTAARTASQQPLLPLRGDSQQSPAGPNVAGDNV